jgi:hypothetical protein
MLGNNVLGKQMMPHLKVLLLLFLNYFFENNVLVVGRQMDVSTKIGTKNHVG